MSRFLLLIDQETHVRSCKTEVRDYIRDYDFAYKKKKEEKKMMILGFQIVAIWMHDD